jgi:hypothetical protein
VSCAPDSDAFVVACAPPVRAASASVIAEVSFQHWCMTVSFVSDPRWTRSDNGTQWQVFPSGMWAGDTGRQTRQAHWAPRIATQVLFMRSTMILHRDAENAPDTAISYSLGISIIAIRCPVESKRGLEASVPRRADGESLPARGRARTTRVIRT